MENVSHAATKYPSTGQFRQVVKYVQDITRYKGKDENNAPIFDMGAEMPVVEYIGTVKIHGTNGSLVMFEDGKIYCQSKERMLAFGCDNAGFWEAMRHADLNALFGIVKERYYEIHGCEAPYPIRISGEWAGGNIQKGVAVNGVEKFFAIFGIQCGEEWELIENYDDVKDPDSQIYNILQFKHYSITIDFNRPAEIQNKLIELTEQVEMECPVGLFFGQTGIGEGVVWKPRIDRRLAATPSSWFKVKGDKHSSSKVKKLASVDTEKLESIKEFVEYAVTESRLEQGVGEVGLDITKVGEFIGWINRDIFKEEMDTLKDNKLEMRDIGKEVSNVARKWYINKINSQ